MVRVAGLQQQLASGTPEVSVDGLDPATQLQLIREEVRKLVDDGRRVGQAPLGKEDP